MQALTLLLSDLASYWTKYTLFSEANITEVVWSTVWELSSRAWPPIINQTCSQAWDPSNMQCEPTARSFQKHTFSQAFFTKMPNPRPQVVWPIHLRVAPILTGTRVSIVRGWWKNLLQVQLLSDTSRNEWVIEDLMAMCISRYRYCYFQSDIFVSI